ncbi:MAG TPA: PASTA domain-containing protein [Acidobacteriaceae bacterium]|nr:PASTA domain-containing protein [Acidobacteriaceae bacterium]
MLRAFQFGLILLMLAALAMISAIVTMHFAIHGAEVTVPNFKGLTVAQATSNAASRGLNLSVDNHYYSVDVPAGHIVGQIPAPGAIVRRAWHVRLIESLGPQKIAVPNLEGLDQRVASIQIRRADLQIGTIAQMPWAYAPEGTVIAQNPAPGSARVARPYVSMLIATPPVATTPTFVMPALTGQLYSAAAPAITQAGLKLAPEKPVPPVAPPASATATAQPVPPAIAPGTILMQSPQPGQPVDASTPIELTVEQ